MSCVFTPRKLTHTVTITNGDTVVRMGGGAPVCVQSMTNTPTEDVEATVHQVRELACAGSELVRLTVNTPQAAKAVPYIREKLDSLGCTVPLVGDFHYNGHKLLTAETECAKALSKYRINPGNVGKGDAHQENFATMIELALKYDKAIRIGVNGGSVDKELLALRIEEGRQTGKEAKTVFLDTVVESTLESAKAAVTLGLPANKLVLSAKVSGVSDLIYVYRALSQGSDFALHLGLTEAGLGLKGVVSSTAALSVLLSEGIGDTIRVSTTPAPGEARCSEVEVAQEILQSLGLRRFTPQVTSCPGCGRTSNELFQRLVKATQDFVHARSSEWVKKAPGSEALRIAVMGCVVNGPGEAGNADIGLSLPGRGESPVAPVFADGKKIASLKGEAIEKDFEAILENYVMSRFEEKIK